jgi:tetratricopeptide (TPR) repeat protein
MLPRALMLTTKNAGGRRGMKSGPGERRTLNTERRTSNGFSAPRRGWGSAGCILLVACLAAVGCKPPGPKALLDGEKLIDRGHYAEAVERLKTATAILSTNADAWNYLGVAYHHAGRPDDAADAYKKALALDQNLVEVHFNLGCLQLEQNHPDLAKAELTAYTLRRDKSLDGFIKLGEAQIEMRDLAGAERSLNQARLMDGQNPEALNDMGVVQLQRNRVTEAAQFFNAALRYKPDYAPAILNMAILSQTHLNNRPEALKRYREYLSLNPRPADWEAVDAAARALEQEIGGAPTPTVRPAPTANPTPQAPAPRSAPVTAARPPKLENPTPVNTRSQPTEVTQVTPEPVIHGAPASTPEPVASNSGSEAGKPERRGFLSRVFHGSPKTNATVVTGAQPMTQPVAPTPEPKPVNYPRYSYQSPRKPAAGDRAAATQAFAEGSRAQQAKEFSTAVTAYRKAIQLDPSYYDAYYNLGVVSVQSGNYAAGLAVYETALAIEPDSHDARFNFALVLKQANYPIDAASELEKVLAKSPNDVYAHYALANLYAQQLRQPARAREHYEKVLALNPSFSQAQVIRNWLFSNPQ